VELSSELLQIGTVVLNALIVLIIVPLRVAISKLQESDEKLASRVHAVELEIAKNYVQRSEMSSSVSTILSKLERIETRLYERIDALDHNKADK
jgi:hypothetical protein